MSERRLSDNAATVLLLFLREPERPRYGREIVLETGIASGSLYPILHRMEDRGFLTAEWEMLSDAVISGRRPRRSYCLNTRNAEHAHAAFDRWQRKVSHPRQPPARVVTA